MVAGRNTPTFRRHPHSQYSEEVCLSVVYQVNGKDRCIDLIAPSNNKRDLWLNGLQTLIKNREPLTHSLSLSPSLTHPLPLPPFFLHTGSISYFFLVRIIIAWQLKWEIKIYSTQSSLWLVTDYLPKATEVTGYVNNVLS